MSTQWRVEVRLGTAADAKPILNVVIEAETEAEALRKAATIADHELDLASQLLQDGQEEVFSRAEVTDGAIEHQANT
ncbi:MAG: hypothetical protein JWP92_847 [Caulobacter sp.]|nr:hypothetical protein [Caulobacter sp.]